MARLVPDEPVTHYQMGTILKAQGDAQAATKEFETARDLDPRLAAPHFQLYGLYRQAQRPAGRRRRAARLSAVEEISRRAPPSRRTWTGAGYAEIYDPVDALPSAPLAPPVYRAETGG